MITRYLDGTSIEVTPKGVIMRDADGKVKVTMGDIRDEMAYVEPKPPMTSIAPSFSMPSNRYKSKKEVWEDIGSDIYAHRQKMFNKEFVTHGLEAMDAKIAEVKKAMEVEAFKASIVERKTLELKSPGVFVDPGQVQADDELADLMKESMKVTAESLREDVKRLIFNLAKAQTQGITESSIHELIEEIMTEEKKTEEQIALEAVAQKLTDHWASEDWVLSSEQFMLNAPINLTILRPEKGYGKQAHIGGEEFEPQRAYVGKKGAIIIVFKPNSMEAYDHMEMTFSDAVQHLTGFQAHLMEVGVFADLAAIKDKKDAVLAAARQKEFGERYGDFGSW